MTATRELEVERTDPTAAVRLEGVSAARRGNVIWSEGTFAIP